jgi:hypothetical protein
MSKERLIVINSKDRQNGTNSDFTISITDSETQQIQKILVKDCFIPNLFYNINNNNNRLVFSQNGLPNITLILRAGQYTLSQFITELETNFNGALINGTTLAITSNPTTYKLTFTFSGGALPADNNVEIFKDGTTISDIIGLNNDIGPSDVLNLPNPYNLTGVSLVQIHSPQVAENHGIDSSNNRGTLINLLETVSLTETAWGSVAHRQNNDDELCEILYSTNLRALNFIRIVLRDESGVKLELPDNAYVTVIIKAYFD